MPTYDYRCEACGHALELFQNISAAPKRKCPKCKKSKLKRQIGGGAGFLFKGSGFYLTDYRSDSYKKAAEADAKPAPAADSAPKASEKAAEKASEKGEAKLTPSPSKEKAKKRSK
ncbi:MAG: zinc ribbon domain-containing protein [Planctomycetes bacterium]|nr:zinc ribbon domain-containing protein [Planctomycetota bacterium]